jgi:hypothetical protein
VQILVDGLTVEVRTEGSVPTAAADRAVRMVRLLAQAAGRPVRYAAVVLSVDPDWRGCRSHQVEATVEAVGLRVRGFAAGRDFAEAIAELDTLLRGRLEAESRRRVPRRADWMRGPVRSADPRATSPSRDRSGHARRPT